MAVIKNKTNERNRAFWSHVESVAKQVRYDSNSTAMDRRVSNRSLVGDSEQEPAKDSTVSSQDPEKK
jgi:hypothetical protein